MNIIRYGLETVADGARLMYAWYLLDDPRRGQWYHTVALRELESLPITVRDDPDVLGKQWAAIRGMYNAEVDFLYAAAGIFTPEHIGVVQLYGASGDGPTIERAARESLGRLAAVEATLANYPQSRLIAPDMRWINWYLSFLARDNNHLLAILGHPDPRLSRRGLGPDARLTDQSADDLAAQQNELLFRGLAKLREDFIFQVTAQRLSRKHLANGLVRIAQVASNVASRRKGQISFGFSLSLPLVAAISQGASGGHATATSSVHGSGDGVSQAYSQGHTDSWAHTKSQSHSEGGSETWGTASSHSVGVSQGTNQGHTDSAGTAHTDSAGTAHTVSQGTAHTDSSSTSHSAGSTVSSGGGSSWGTSDSAGQSAGSSIGQSAGSSIGQSASVSAGQSVGHSAGHGSTDSIGISANNGASHSVGTGYSDSTGLSQSHSQGTSASASVGIPGVASGSAGVSDSSSVGSSAGHADTGSASDAVSHGAAMSAGHSASANVSDSSSQSQSVSTGVSASHSTGVSASQSAGVSASHSASAGGSSFSSVSSSESTSTTHGSADTVSHGTADTTSKGTADTTSKGTADSKGTSTGVSETDTTTNSHSIGRSWSDSVGTADTVGGADSKSQAWGQSHSDSQAVGDSLGRSGATAFGNGFSTGLIPGISLGRSWQTEDDVADRLTEVLRGLEGILNQASAEGGFMADALLVTASQRGATAGAALVPQAFHGPNVPTPILTIPPQDDDEEALRVHALAFVPVPDLDDGDPFDGLLWRRYSTLLTAGQLAAYTAPGLFGEGTAVVVTEAIPQGVGFYPTMSGDVTLGHQYSPETAELTTAPVRLDPARHFHTLFAADTGFGKTVSAERMVYEMTLKWQMPTVVLDWGAGWRKLLNAPGLDGHVNILQLWPDAVRPLRWNPLQIGRNIPPETQWRAFADIFGAIARLGVKRQKQELLEALRKIYLRAGVLVDDPDVRADPEMGAVRPGEDLLINVPSGTPLAQLTATRRQQLAVRRSRDIGLRHLYQEIRDKLENVPPRDTTLTGVLEGILFRMNALVQGAAALQYAPGEDTIQVEALLQDWGVTIIEGGSFLDEFGKAFLLGWLGWRLYTDSVARRVHAGQTLHYAQIVFEEANKIFGGIADGGSGEDDGGGAAYTAQQFGNMFRDSRKYGIWLHVISQSPHLIPPDIVSSCNNLIVGFLKNPRDKDVILSALAKSEKGFTDEPWRRFLSDLHIGQFLGRFSYADVRHKMRPTLFRPLRLDVPEPTDEDIVAKIGAIQL